MNNTIMIANSDIHKWLYLNKMTQTDLAERLGLHPESVRRYLRHSGSGWPLRTAHMVEEITGVAAERLSPRHPRHGG